MILRSYLISCFAMATPLVGANVAVALTDQEPFPQDALGWFTKYGTPNGFFIFLGWCVWKLICWVRPKAEAWFDAGIRERDSYRVLAEVLKQRFEEEHVEERKMLREALTALREIAPQKPATTQTVAFV